MVTYRMLPGAMVGAHNSSQYISMTIADLCMYNAGPRASENIFVLVAVNVNTRRAVRAALFNVHNVAAAQSMTDFVTSFGKDEVLVVAPHSSIPSYCCQMVVGMLRSVRGVGHNLRVLDSPYVQVGDRRPYLLDGMVHETRRPGSTAVAVNVRVIQIPLEIIAAMRTGGPVPLIDSEETDNDWPKIGSARAKTAHALTNDNENELQLSRDMASETRPRQTKASVDTFLRQTFPGVILVTTDMVLHLGVDGDVLRVTGYSANEFLALDPARDFLSPDADRAKVDSLFTSLVDPSQPFVEINMSYVHKDGHTIWLRICHGTRVIGTASSGNPKVLLVFSDVTEAVAVQQAQRQALDRFLRWMEFVFFEMVVDDLTGTRRIKYINTKSADTFGLTHDELTFACKWTEMLHPDDVERYEASLAESKASMEVWNHEYRVVVEGEIKHLHGRASPRREGTTVVWDGVLEDVTVSSMTKNRDIRNAVAKKLKAASAYLSHEIRNQLQPQSLALGMMKDEESKWTDTIDMILDANRTVTTILSQVLDLAKWESGDFPINATLFPIMRLFEAIATYAKATGASVEGLASILPTWYVRADEQVLKQAATNLLSNASKFSEGRPVVIVFAFEHTNDKEGVIVVTVADEGRGMTPEQLVKVMGPFGQLRKADDASSGTGLGLSLTKEMIETGHKGALTLKSQGLGKGTTATMRVPVQWENRHEEQHVKSDPLWWVTPHPGVTKDILVVDDSKMVCMMTIAVARKAGLTYNKASDGMEAVELLRNNTYSIVFMDRQMLVMNGDVATEKARANGYTLPIVMVSGDTFQASEGAELKR